MESSCLDSTAWFWPKSRCVQIPNSPQARGVPIYRSLDKAKREIRICDLGPSSKFPAPLQCSLRTVPIHQAGSFIALSYVWGIASSTECIIIDGVKHPIRPNLAAGLRRIRERFSGKHQVISLWADAICINQNCIEERNHQVPLMRSIFSACESAFAWLGESDETSDLAMDCIIKMNQFQQRIMTGPASFLWMLVQEEFFWEAAPWMALTKLLKREFWFRVWIYQEVVLPKTLIVGCGSRILPWENFLALNGMITLRGDSGKSSKLLRKHFSHLDPSIRNEITIFCNMLHPIFEHKVNINQGRMLKIFDLLAETIHLRCTDPRDKIYGLLALDQTSTFSPDYSKTVQEVYTTFARTMLLENLAYLRFGGLVTRELTKATANLPTWVPHWESISRSIFTPVLQEGKCFEDPRPFRANIEFYEKRGTQILFVNGEISSKIAWIKGYSNFLQIESFRSVFSKIAGTKYPTDIEYPTTPIERVLALCCTLVRSLFLKNSREDMELAAGFCYAVEHRLGAGQAKILSSEVYTPFGDHFGWIAWAAAEKTARMSEKDYLAREKESFQGRVLFETESGYFGFAPIGVKPGDFLCQIYGYQDPVVLRQVDSHYLLIGSCWALDYTDHNEYDRRQSVMIEIW